VLSTFSARERAQHIGNSEHFPGDGLIDVCDLLAA
jgi:hypothetical protein